MACGRARRLVRAADGNHLRYAGPGSRASPHDEAPVADPLGDRAAVVFATELAVDRVPSIRAIRAALHVGQSCAQRPRR